MLFRTLILSSRRKHSDYKETVDTMSKRFSDLINYCESTKFRGFECPKRYWEMSSLEETKGRKKGKKRCNISKMVERRHFATPLRPSATSRFTQY